MISELLKLIKLEYQQLAPFVNILKYDIESLTFSDMEQDETAQIKVVNNKYYIEINNSFIEEYQLTKVDILWLICHEISHFILGHLNPKYFIEYAKEFCNFAFDCQVNSMLFNINYKNRIELFEKSNWESYHLFLDGDFSKINYLLVPPPISEAQFILDASKTSIEKSKIELIKEFWFQNYSPLGLSLEKIFLYLIQIVEEDVLSGDLFEFESSSKSGTGDNELPEYSKKIIQLIEKHDNDAEKSVGDEQYESINKVKFQENKINNSKKKIAILARAIEMAMFPVNYSDNVVSKDRDLPGVFPKMSRKEVFLLMNGYLPFFYRIPELFKTHEALNIYIDFSSSTSEFHNEICSLISNFKHLNKMKIFGFSMKVFQIPFENLRKQQYDGTGTYITPVVNHINMNKFKKVLIITDGQFLSPNGTTDADIYAVLLSKNNSEKNLEKIGNLKQVWYLNK